MDIFHASLAQFCRFRSPCENIDYVLQENDLLIIDTLLHAGVSIENSMVKPEFISAERKENIKRNPLQTAVEFGDYFLVKELLKRNANRNVLGNEGESLLHILLSKKRNLKEIIQVITEKDCRIINLPNDSGETPLISVIYSFCNKNTYNKHIETEKALDTIQILIDCGADIEQKNDQGNTPLQISILTLNSILVKKLLAAGANFTSDDNLIDLLFTSFLNSDTNPYLPASITDLYTLYDRIHALKEILNLLLTTNTSINNKNPQGITPLHLACTQINTTNIYRANSSEILTNFTNILHLTMSEIIETLLRHGADSRLSDPLGILPYDVLFENQEFYHLVMSNLSTKNIKFFNPLDETPEVFAQFAAKMNLKDVIPRLEKASPEQLNAFLDIMQISTCPYLFELPSMEPKDLKIINFKVKPALQLAKIGLRKIEVFFKNHVNIEIKQKAELRIAELKEQIKKIDHIISIPIHDSQAPEIPENLKCPVTKQLIVRPAKDMTTGIIYEETILISWVTQHGVSPYGNTLTLDQIEYDEQKAIELKEFREKNFENSLGKREREKHEKSPPPKKSA